jgi:hypothetical protein
MNKRILVWIPVVILLLAGTTATAAGGNFGLGVIVGEPTGVSLKIWTAENRAFDGGLAWSLGHDYTFHFHADYLFHEFSLITVEKGRLPLYYGIGGRIKILDDDIRNNDNDDRIGIRFPVGLEYLFDNAPFDIFLEVVPILDLTPETEVDLNAAIGFRYFF